MPFKIFYGFEQQESELHTENKLSQQCHDNYKHGMAVRVLRREQSGEWYNLRKNSLIGK